MNDFSQILDAWENRGHRRDKEPFDKDRAAVEETSVPSRIEMDRARPEDELDLHGMLVEEAVAALGFFLRDSRWEGYRKVLIIHGKGLHSENRKGVLRDAVQQCLSRDKNVASWGEAGRKEGGGGASWVWLRNRSTPTVRGK